MAMATWEMYKTGDGDLRIILLGTHAEIDALVHFFFSRIQPMTTTVFRVEDWGHHLLYDRASFSLTTRGDDDAGESATAVTD
jgi:hypothetical protein